METFQGGLKRSEGAAWAGNDLALDLVMIRKFSKLNIKTWNKNKNKIQKRT